MAGVQSVGWRRAALAISIGGVVAGLAGVVAAVIYLKIRPACPPGYRHLLDASLAMPWASGFLALAAGSCCLSSLAAGRYRLAVVTGSAVTAVAIGLLVITSVSLAQVGSVGTCWAS